MDNTNIEKTADEEQLTDQTEATPGSSEVSAQEEATPGSSEVSAQEEPQTDAAVLEAPKKKSKAPLIILIVLVILAAAGFFVYQNLPSTKAGKLIKQAQTLIESKDYAKAIETLITARDTDPSNPDIKDTFLAVFDANAGDILSSSVPDYVKAIEVYVSAEKLLPDDIDTLYQKEADIYKLWAKEDAKTNDMDVLKAQIERLSGAIQRGLPGLGVTKSELEKQLSQLEADKALTDFAVIFTAAAEAVDIRAMHDLFNQNIKDPESELFQKTISKRGTRSSSYPIIADLGKENKLGIYYKNSEYFIYYGTYDANGKRSGAGMWLTTRGNEASGLYRTYFYSAMWESDKPNGTVYLELYTRFSNGSQEAKHAQATVKNGLFDGEFVYSYDAIGDLNVIYSNGDPVQIDTRTDSDGSEIKVYGYNYDHSKMLVNLQMHDGVFGTY